MLSNLLALLGVVCIVVAVAGLAGGWWALLVCGVVLLVVAFQLFATAPPAGEGGGQ